MLHVVMSHCELDLDREKEGKEDRFILYYDKILRSMVLLGWARGSFGPLHRRTPRVVD